MRESGIIDTADSPDDRLDRATSARLRRLRSVPVDTSGLERVLRSKLPARPPPHSTVRVWFGGFRPLAAVAAVLAVALTIALTLSNSGGPALASPGDLTRIHAEVAAGSSHATPVASLGQAADALEARHARSLRLPRAAAAAVRSCCVHQIGRRHAACVCLELDGGPVTLMVARASDLRSASGHVVERAGVRYVTHAEGGRNIVASERGGNWFCLVGEQPLARLLDLASTVQF